jgi:hypothetical protein
MIWSILNGFEKAAFQFLSVGVVIVIYRVTKYSAEQSVLGPRWFTAALIACTAFAGLGAMGLGNASCAVQDGRGGCDEYNDDAYTPTNEQREKQFGYMLALLVCPTMMAAINERGKRKRRADAPE